jgi:hypothetical protein
VTQINRRGGAYPGVAPQVLAAAARVWVWVWVLVRVWVWVWVRVRVWVWVWVWVGLGRVSSSPCAALVTKKALIWRLYPGVAPQVHVVAAAARATAATRLLDRAAAALAAVCGAPAAAAAVDVDAVTAGASLASFPPLSLWVEGCFLPASLSLG